MWVHPNFTFVITIYIIIFPKCKEKMVFSENPISLCWWLTFMFRSTISFSNHFFFSFSPVTYEELLTSHHQKKKKTPTTSISFCFHRIFKIITQNRIANNWEAGRKTMKGPSSRFVWIEMKKNELISKWDS